MTAQSQSPRFIASSPSLNADLASLAKAPGAESATKHDSRSAARRRFERRRAKGIITSLSGLASWGGAGAGRGAFEGALHLVDLVGERRIREGQVEHEPGDAFDAELAVDHVARAGIGQLVSAAPQDRMRVVLGTNDS